MLIIVLPSQCLRSRLRQALNPTQLRPNRRLPLGLYEPHDLGRVSYLHYKRPKTTLQTAY
jgi:hypothetical protein